MKNENTQHTPEFKPLYFNGTHDGKWPSLKTVNVNHNMDGTVTLEMPEQKIGITFRDELVSRWDSAPYLLKENEQLKEEIAELKTDPSQASILAGRVSKLISEKKELQALNAELLEALKAATNKSYRYGVTPYTGDSGERWIKYEQRVSEADYNKIQSAIAKAEGKTLGVS